jgi:ketosteroid isomerase-like protein
MRNRTLVILAMLIFTILACNPHHNQQLDLESVRKFVETQNAKWFTAVSRYDVATLLTIYTEDATLMPPNFPMLKGSRQIKAYYDRMSSKGIRISKAVMNTLELTGRDSTVYEIGQYIMDIERPEMPIVSDTGKYNTIWKLQYDGSWKIYADCWNSNKPLRLIPQKNN